MRKFLLFLFVVCLFRPGIAQVNKNQEVDIVSHSVEMGETVRMLSKKYLVEPSEIYRLNKFAVNGIHQGDVLQIPVPRKEVPIIEEQPTETTTEEAPQEAVPEESTTEQPKKVQKKRSKKTTEIQEIPAESESNASPSEHTVVSGETLFSLSRQYGVSVSAIKSANLDGLKKGLKVGQVIQIPSGSIVENNAPAENNVIENRASAEPTQNKIQEIKPEEVAAISPEASSNEQVISHKVAPKETLYSLSKRYGVTVDDIKNQNPEVAQHGLQIGQTLTIRKQ